jgi:membrane dipeptidase
VAAGRAREKVTLRRLIEAIDYICQIAGDAQHAAIGSDFDGGFGLDSIPSELNSIADLAKIGTALYQQGYSSADVEAILNGNWLRMLKKSLPQA